MRSLARSLGVGLVALAALAASPARAEPAVDAEVVGILDVSTQGVSETAGELFEQSVEEGLAGTGFAVVRSQTLGERLSGSDYLEGCTFGPCLRALEEATGIRLVLVARIHGEGSSYGFVISLVDARSGRVTSQVADTCEVCTVEEAIGTATMSVVALVTGTGEAEVINPAAGPTGSSPPTGSSAPHARHTARTGWVFVGAGLAAGALGGYLWRDDREVPAAGALSAGGALVVGGVGMLILSRTF